MTPGRTHTCAHCTAAFTSSIPAVSHPLSLLCPTLTGTRLTFQSSSLPDVSAAFEGMDHLAEESDLLDKVAARAYLQTVGVKVREGCDVLRGA